MNSPSPLSLHTAVARLPAPALAITSLVLAGAATIWSTDAHASDGPNVVFILADDIGYSDVAAYYEYISGVTSVLPTPNLDRLAQEGMMFTDAHSPASLCAPTRYSAMTGNYPYRSRVPGGVWPSYAVSAVLPGQTPIAATMKAVGYRTAFFGKWGFGAEWYDDAGNIIAPEYDDTTVDVAAGIARGGPVDQGFDYSFNLPSGIQNSPYAYFENNDWYPLSIDSVIEPLSAATHEPLGSVRDGSKGDSEYDSRDAGPMLASKAVAFIDDHLQTHPDSPFLLYYSSQAVHVPHTPSESLDGQPVQGATGISAHADLIHELDLQVGAIISKLELEGILDQTLIIFTSDNGGLDKPETLANGHDSNLGLRGKKGSIHEGGHRVPFIVRWPGVVVPGTLSDQTILISDWVATMYDMLGIPMGSEDALDAVSILPVLAGLQDENDPIRDRFIVQAGACCGDTAIRDGDDILIYNYGIQIEFYNLASDLLQTQDLLADPAYQARIAEMDALYQADHSSSRTSPALDYSDPNVRTQWAEVCGNGIIAASESCDDSGTTPGDGCDASCQIESGYVCSGAPSVCQGMAAVPALSPWSIGLLATALMGSACWAHRKQEQYWRRPAAGAHSG